MHRPTLVDGVDPTTFVAPSADEDAPDHEDDENGQDDTEQGDPETGRVRDEADEGRRRDEEADVECQLTKARPTA